MIYQIIAVFIFIVAIIALALSAKFLLNKKWLIGFSRGCLGLFLLLLTVLLGFSASDIFSYKAVENNYSVVTLSFRKKEGNSYHVELQEAGGSYYASDIEGQQWQLNMRMFKWTPLFGAVGFRPGYRLEDISGRFIELQLDKMVEKPELKKMNVSGQIDVWQFLNQHPAAFPSVEAYIGSPGFIPVADGAIYDVILSGQNLTVNPLNDAAQSALKIL